HHPDLHSFPTRRSSDLKGLVIENPNAPPAVRALSPTDAQVRCTGGDMRLVDVRPPDERAIAAVPVPHATLDDGPGALEGLAKDRSEEHTSKLQSRENLV